MAGESKSKHYVWTEMSNKYCPDCGRRIKAKIAASFKGIPKCYICFKISKGKKEIHKYKVEKGYLIRPLTIIKTIDLLKLQKDNRRKYGWHEKKNN